MAFLESSAASDFTEAGEELRVFPWDAPTVHSVLCEFLGGFSAGSDGGFELKPIRRAAKAVPLTAQELLVRDLLETLGLPYETQVFVELPSGPVIMDFRIDGNWMLECSCSMGRQSSSLGFLRRAAAFVDWKFREIRREYGAAHRLMVLFEGPNLDPMILKQTLKPMFEHADSVFFDLDEFAEFLASSSQAGQAGEDDSAWSGQHRLERWSKETPSVDSKDVVKEQNAKDDV